MAQDVKDAGTKPPSRDDVIDHMADELRELEGLNKPRWPKIVLWVVVLGAIAGLYYYYEIHRKPPEDRAWIGPASTSGVQIEMMEPRAGKLAGPPSHFAWESVSGRHDYMFTLYVKDDPKPILEKSVKRSTLDLKPEEAGLLTSGKTYVWKVQARDETWKELAAGQSWFEVP